MPNPYFRFKQFTVYHNRSAMKVTTDGCLFGAWCAQEINAPGKNEKKALDIGTGTGLLSLMVAQKNNLQIDAVELDVSAAGQAKKNVAASPWKENIRVYPNDILAFNFPHQYDCIFSNPPFYETELHSVNAQKNIAHHSHGLRLQPLVQIIKKQLRDEGSFYLLLPYKRITEIERSIALENLYIEKKVVVRQSIMHQPFRIMIKGGKRETITENLEMAVCSNQQQYTPEFVALLKDYYLYL